MGEIETAEIKESRGPLLPWSLTWSSERTAVNAGGCTSSARGDGDVLVLSAGPEKSVTKSVKWINSPPRIMRTAAKMKPYLSSLNRELARKGPVRKPTPARLNMLVVARACRRGSLMISPKKLHHTQRTAPTKPPLCQDFV